MKTDCEKIEPLLGAYIDGELNEADVKTVEAHLTDCAECRGVTDTFREVDGLYGNLACETPTDGRWKSMLWNVLPRAEIPQMPDARLTAGPRRIPMAISGQRSHRWAGVTATVLALAGMVLVVTLIVLGRPETGQTGPGALARDNTCSLVEVDNTAEGYEVGLQLPADAGDLLVVDIMRADDSLLESI